MLSAETDNEDTTVDDLLFGPIRENNKEIQKHISIISDCYEKIKYQMYTAYGEEIYEAAGNK